MLLTINNIGRLSAQRKIGTRTGIATNGISSNIQYPTVNVLGKVRNFVENPADRSMNSAAGVANSKFPNETVKK
jgi:hypothetical protein